MGLQLCEHAPESEVDNVSSEAVAVVLLRRPVRWLAVVESSIRHLVVSSLGSMPHVVQDSEQKESRGCNRGKRGVTGNTRVPRCNKLGLVS